MISFALIWPGKPDYIYLTTVDLLVVGINIINGPHCSEQLINRCLIYDANLSLCVSCQFTSHNLLITRLFRLSIICVQQYTRGVVPGQHISNTTL